MNSNKCITCGHVKKPKQDKDKLKKMKNKLINDLFDCFDMEYDEKTMNKEKNINKIWNIFKERINNNSLININEDKKLQTTIKTIINNHDKVPSKTIINLIMNLNEK